MTGQVSIGADLARSLVDCLGADCGVAAALASVVRSHPEYAIDKQTFVAWPTPSVARVTADFVARGWLTPSGAGWRAGPGVAPPGLESFLQGAAAMQATKPDSGTAIAVVTMPPSPSAIATALPATGLAYAALVATNHAFERVAREATTSFTIMTPFLNDDGLVFALELFRQTRASQRRLVVRLSGKTRGVVDRGWCGLDEGGVEVFNYCLPTADGQYETFHAKVVIADRDLAYVGSANMTAFARHSMELGILADGRAAHVVANVVQGVLRIAKRVRRPNAAAAI
jgi:PLD-like domain